MESRSTGTWNAADQAIKLEKEHEGCLDISLSYFEFSSGATYRFGDTFVTMVCGFDKPPSEWGLLNASEKRNAGSVVIRIQHKGMSILFTGDTFGRHIDDPPETCIAAEKFMVDMSEVVKIDSDVLIAPHHGADNGSSTDFIRVVSPDFVVFPAGHKYKHPRAQAATRHIGLGVSKARTFRTDRGDDEGSEEWDEGRIKGHFPAPESIQRSQVMQSYLQVGFEPRRGSQTQFTGVLRGCRAPGDA